VCGDSPAGGTARTQVARSVTASTGGASAKEQQLTFVSGGGLPLNPLETAHALPARHDGSEDGTGRGIPLVSDTVTAKWAKGVGGPSGDETQNLITWPKEVAPALTARFYNDYGIDNQHVNGGCGLFVSDEPPLAFDCKNDPAPATLSPPLRAMGHHRSRPNGGGQVAVAAPILEPGARTGVSTSDTRCGDGIGAPGDPMFTLQAGHQHGVMVHWAQGGGDVEDNVAGALRVDAEHNYQFLRQPLGVRRLTPRECERLQGFPDDYTLVPWRSRRPKDYGDMVAYLIASGFEEKEAHELAMTPDGHRYKALGNAMAVPVMRWIGLRIMEIML
jgi:hypothetical protein